MEKHLCLSKKESDVKQTCPVCEGELEKTKPIGEIRCKVCNRRAAIHAHSNSNIHGITEITMTLTSWDSFKKVKKLGQLIMV